MEFHENKAPNRSITEGPSLGGRFLNQTKALQERPQRA